MKIEEIFRDYHAKRAMEVALAGNHSIQFIGSWWSNAGILTAWAREHGLKTRMVAPCPCGFFGDPIRECTCSLTMISKWQCQKFNPREQWDITVEVPTESNANEILAWLRGKRSEPESAMFERIEGATDDVDMQLDDACSSLLRAAINQLSLSFGQVRSIMAVAKSICRLARAERLECAYLAEAIQYRQRRQYGDR